MQVHNAQSSDFALIREMISAVDVIRTFVPDVVRPFADRVSCVRKLLLSGEGSSRIFPAKNAVNLRMRRGSPFAVVTESGRQAMEYDLEQWAVFGASNSGKTRETIGLMAQLKQRGNANRFGVTNARNSPLEALCNGTYILHCGDENAVAATKSVIEQALFFHALIRVLVGAPLNAGELLPVADAFADTLAGGIPREVLAQLIGAKRLYFCGRNNGVAEELTLKANEIARLPASYLENTYAVHGIEEVMRAGEAVVIVEPFEEEMDKFKEVLGQGVGLNLVAISKAQQSIPTIRIPDCGEFTPYIELAAGWNLLVALGLQFRVDLDRPTRARKIGNEAVHPQLTI